jgi:pyridoxamine 5'-phosphate oxidase
MSASPMAELKKWYRLAERAKISEPNAVALATATKKGVPSCRYVLVKDLQDDGVVFFTNYNSRKGRELLENPYAAITFYWGKFSRQVRLEGAIKKVSKELSDSYFMSRPKGAQISAAVSPQSRDIPGTEWLIEQWTAFEAQNGGVIERPGSWGGFILKPTQVEFWQGQKNRMHDRVVYKKRSKGWQISILAP